MRAVAVPSSQPFRSVHILNTETSELACLDSTTTHEVGCEPAPYVVTCSACLEYAEWLIRSQSASLVSLARTIESLETLIVERKGNSDA